MYFALSNQTAAVSGISGNSKVTIFNNFIEHLRTKPYYSLASEQIEELGTDKLTQQKIAEIMDVDVSTIANILTNGSFSFDTFERMRFSAQLTPNELYSYNMNSEQIAREVGRWSHILSKMTKPRTSLTLRFDSISLRREIQKNAIQHRKINGLSVHDVEEFYQIPERTLKKFENQPTFSFDTMERIRCAYALAPNELYPLEALYPVSSMSKEDIKKIIIELVDAQISLN